MDATFSRLTMTAASALLLLARGGVWRRHGAAYNPAVRTQAIALR